MISRQIFAWGDNSFRARPDDNQKLYRHILSATGKENPRVLLIPTASGDAQDYIDAFHAFFRKLGGVTDHLSLFRGDRALSEQRLIDQDLIYVSGGNTRNLLVLWREWGLDEWVRRAYERGTVMAGGSAGSLCWFEGGVTDSVPPGLTAMKCLGILRGSHCPHYNEITRRPDYQRMVGTGELPGGYAVDNGVVLHFRDGELVEAVSETEREQAYRVERESDGTVRETAIPVRRLR
jgi:dipeptidase E